MTVNLIQTVSGLLKTYGEPLFLEQEKITSFQGILQPILSKDHGGDSLGFGGVRGYKAYFPAVSAVEGLVVGDHIYSNNGQFRIGSIEGYRLGGATVYFKAIVYRTEGLN